ncbi:MAG: synthase gamma chain [Patescibacteria group bacterium]|jgi:F-type H+-transporting ATPase subunit gamma|nr:synthase gamma chain [Patescibacteria group bacterium]
MATARQVKQRISTAKNISKITKAMEMVSASKMKRAQDQTLAARPYAQALADSLRTLAKEATPDLHPLLSNHTEGIDVLIIISTDRGLCGSLNQNMFKKAMEWYKAHPKGEFIVVGKKAVAFAQFLGLDVIAQFTSIPDRVSLSDILPITTLAIEKFTEKYYRSVSIVYMDFINTLSQKAHLSQLLPINNLSDDQSLVETERSEYIFEPTPKEILQELLPYYVENSVYQSFLEGKASEHSARMVAMKNASENAKDLVKELQLLFNKSRQESITKELLEITTATMTLES